MGGKLSSEELSKRHVVIIGGGYAGMELGTILLKWEVPFTIIDPKEYFHHVCGGLRAVVDANYSKRTTIPFKPTFGPRFVQAKVVGVDFVKKLVLVDNGDPISYTDLVIAVGSTGTFFSKYEEGTIDEAAKYKQEVGAEIDKATNVIIVGGGPVGIELAGEIADKYSAKQITIIHSNTSLCTPRFGDAFQEKLKSQLENKRVVALLGERVANLNDLTLNKFMKQTVKTDKGNTYEADIVIKCIGLVPQTSLTETIFDASKFDSSRRIKVTPELTVVGEQNVYAIGDCCNTPEEKMAAFCSAHADTVAKNIWRSMKNQEKVAYKQPFSGMIVTTGTWSGVGIINGWNVPSLLVGLLKGRSLFVSKYWSMMGQTEPC